MKSEFQYFKCPNCHEAMVVLSSHFECKNCKSSYPITSGISDFLLVNDKPNGNTLIKQASHFDDLAEVYETSQWGGTPKAVVWLINRKIKNKNGIGLDIACGTGQVAIPMARKMEQVYGVDISMGMLQKALELSQKETINNISFARCDSENLPFGDNSYDFISCSGALHAFPNAENSLREMQRVMKVGGVLTIMTLLEKKVSSSIDPTRRELKKTSSKEETVKFYKAKSSMENLNVKLHRFTLDELKILIDKLGLRNFKYIKFGPIIVFSVKK
jgi:ubiquinone/menaquinone biosynthesis C-methylase UbiE